MKFYPHSFPGPRAFARFMLHEDRLLLRPMVSQVTSFEGRIVESVLFRESCWQVELVAALADAHVDRHRHLRCSSADVLLNGELTADIGGRATSAPVRGDLAAQLKTIRRGEWHAGSAGPAGVVYLSFQQWEGEPDFISNDWEAMEAAVTLHWGRPDGVLVSRWAVVDEARAWLKTTYRHQHETKGYGVDCGGLIRGVSVALGLIPANYRDLVPESLRGYGRNATAELERFCDACLTRIDTASVQPGDVLLIRLNNALPQHSAIVADDPRGGLSMIHSSLPQGQVVENSIRWIELNRSNGVRLHAAYSLPGVG